LTIHYYFANESARGYARALFCIEVSVIQPHAYQVPIIKNVSKALKRDGKTLMVMATGTGKTITGALVVEKLLRSKDRMLFLCHTNDILRQSILAYGKVFNGSRSMGMFTGDEKVDPKSVQFLFASFQTMNGWKDKFDPKDFDMIVVDESHHAQAETYRPTIEYFRPKYLLGMTATPDREDGKNIRDLFGDPSVTLSLEEAIARKYLSDIKYKLMTVGTASRDAINELKRRVQAGERITLRELNDNIFIERLDSDIADDIMSYKAQGIIFCTDIKQAEGMAKLLKKARPYHSKLDRNELDADLEGFRRGRIKYLLTVNMFNEGIDVPDTELVVFLRSTESRTVYLQQLGRGLRKSPGKTHVTVLDFVGNCDRIKMVSDFIKKIDDFGPKGKGLKRGPRIRREIDVSSIIFELDQEARDIRDILGRLEKDVPIEIDGEPWCTVGMYVEIASLGKVQQRKLHRQLKRPEHEFKRRVSRNFLGRAVYIYPINLLKHLTEMDSNELLIVDKNGCSVSEGENWTTLKRGSKILNVGDRTIRLKVQGANLPSKVGRNHKGQVLTLYRLSDIKRIVGLEVNDLLRADETGFAKDRRTLWAPRGVIANKYGLHERTILRRIGKNCRTRPGRLANGHSTNFYVVEEVLNVCRDLLKTVVDN